VLDDVGMGKSSSSLAVGGIESMLCERANHDRWTFVTTNLAPDDFWPLFGSVNGRLADRFLGDRIGRVSCLEASRRRKGAA
jgi:hypothetical protein